MKKPLKKTLKWTALVVVLLVIAGAVTLFLSLNGIIRSTVQKESGNQLQLPTELQRANLSLMGGSLTLDDFQIGSPPGFTADRMLSLEKLDVSVDWGALNDNPVHVKSISIKKPRLVIEQAGGKLNFKAAMDQIMPPGTTPPPTTTTAPPAEQDPMRLIIDTLTVENAEVVIRPGLDLPIPIAELKQEYVIQVPSVSIKNIGTGEGARNGAAVKDVAMQLITVLAAQAANSDQLPGGLQDLLNVNVADVAARFSEEAQKQLVQAIPGEFGKTLAGFLDDPDALMKDPGKVLGGKVQDLKAGAQERIEGEIGGRVGDLLGGKDDGEADPEEEGAEDKVKKGIGDGLQGLLGGKKGEDKDEEEEDEK